jgi:O-succinylhomoserine sulfhydrylase
VIETFMPRYGVEFTLVDSTDVEAWRAAIRPNTKTFFLESPSNPTLDVSDIAAVASLAKGCGARLIVDNIFASPILQRPFELGADVVVYSTTKHMDGSGRTLGGAILGSTAFMEEHIDPYLRHTGPAMSPFVAWNVIKALRHCPCGLSARALMRRVWPMLLLPIQRSIMSAIPTGPTILNMSLRKDR